MLTTSDLGRVELWFRQHKRDLPWREQRSPYRVWLAEIMLQQTQVATVVDYYNRFVSRFPTIADLAQAPEDEVLSMWSGLGYYSRCHNLHLCAKFLIQKHEGVFPDQYSELLSLPGIGTYTAGAIMAFAFNRAAPVVDGNISRVLARVLNDHTLVNSPQGKRHFENISLELAQKASCISDFQEGLMEIGATLCKAQNPLCSMCPLQSNCLSHRVGNPNDLPKKTTRLTRSTLPLVCAIICDSNHLWLEKNGPKGLFKGLYTPPSASISHIDQIKTTLEELLRNRALSYKKISKDPIIVKRALTHRDVILHGFLIEVDECKPDGNWISRNQIKNIGLSTATRILLLQTLPDSWHSLLSVK